MTFILSQTFAPWDLLILLLLFVMEIFLSADNILGISIILDRIDPKKRRASLLLGIWTSLFVRALLLSFAAYLFEMNPLQVVGGTYLLYLTYSHLRHKKSAAKGEKKNLSLWFGILSIELTDVLFAIDSILLALGLLSFLYNPEEIPSKVWVAYLGGAFGMITLRFFATSLLLFLQKHPVIEKIAYYLIGWIGVKLIVSGLSFHHGAAIIDTIFAIGVVGITLYAFSSTKWRKRDKMDL